MSDTQVLDQQQTEQTSTPIALYEQLLLAAKTKAGGFEDKQQNESDKDFLLRLGRTISKVDDNVWNNLSEEAQGWYNRVARTANSVNPDVSVPTGYQLTDSSLLQKEVVVTKPQDGNAPRTVPQTPPDKKQVKGISEAIREIVIEHMDFTGEQIKGELVARGWEDTSAKMSSITTVRADVLATMRVATRLGWKKE